MGHEPFPNVRVKVRVRVHRAVYQSQLSRGFREIERQVEAS